MLSRMQVSRCCCDGQPGPTPTQPIWLSQATHVRSDSLDWATPPNDDNVTFALATQAGARQITRYTWTQDNGFPGFEPADGTSREWCSLDIFEEVPTTGTFETTVEMEDGATGDPLYTYEMSALVRLVTRAELDPFARYPGTFVEGDLSNNKVLQALTSNNPFSFDSTSMVEEVTSLGGYDPSVHVVILVFRADSPIKTRPGAPPEAFAQTKVTDLKVS